MGVKDLWNILSPTCERKPLYELEGKTIAVDLSCWIVDSQNVSTQPKMYLRNLFFRTSYFLLHNITPVFVLEGTAPTLKHNTIAKRNENRPGAEERKKSKKGGRTQFNHVLKECKEMLKFMGLKCIQSEGEAEALCAYLNEDGLVDGCISQDSDCFLYGAKIVYRNFCTVKQGSSGSVDEYSIEKIQRIHSLGRNKMVALALICGCDYGDGLFGVGKEAALKFFKTVDECEVLDRMKQWKTSSKFERMESEISNPDICTNCGHSGKAKSHTKVGCLDCGTTRSCKDGYKEKRTLMINELAIRKKALEIENFPNQEVIDEFLVRKASVPSKLDLKWEKPRIIKFIAFMERVVQWEPEYAISKILPIAMRWQLLNLSLTPSDQRQESEIFVPLKIQKKRNIRGIASYEILWDDKGILNDIHISSDSDKENSEKSTEKNLVTIEPQELFSKCYPSIVEAFEESKIKKKAKPKKQKNTKEAKNKTKKDNLKNKKITDFVTLEQLENSLKSLNINTNVKSLQIEEIDKHLSEMEITPRQQKNVETESVEEETNFDGILSRSLEDMFNELTPDDFPSDYDISDEDLPDILTALRNN